MASVTVPGTGTSTISEAFNNQYNSALAQQIADALAAASNAHTLNITTASGGDFAAGSLVAGNQPTHHPWRRRLYHTRGYPAGFPTMSWFWTPTRP